MKKTARLFPSLLILIVLVFGSFGAAPAAPQPPASIDWQSKVDPWVLQTASRGETEFLVFLDVQADLSGASSLPTKREKGAFVYQQLSETAQRTQGPLLRALAARGVEFRPYWAANLVWVRGDMSLVQSLAQRSDVAHLYANPAVKMDLPPEEAASPGDVPAAPDTVEWNIAKVNAPQVWAAGYTGQGVVIAGQDTGYYWQHAALQSKYRGWNGSSADHNYNWHDSIHSGGGTCGPNSPQPCDDYGHGTHTMGTMVGDDGGSNQVGMAPGARWIGCRNMDQGVGTPQTYIECYQFFIAPTDLSGNNPRPDLAPDIINNSWGCPVSEGCTDPNVMLLVVNAVRAAGILTVHSAGNDGIGGCSTVDTPAAIYDSSFTVGNTTVVTSTTSRDLLAPSSSRGPVTVDGSGRMKPDISAPGTNIRSTLRSGGYGPMSGTSMAGPHVAGLAALLLSARPELKGDVDLLKYAMTSTAVPVSLPAVQTCGGIPSTQIPNNSFGWGRIDALAAYNKHLIQLEKQVSAGYVSPGETFTYTLNITHTHPTSPTSGVVLSDTIPAGTSFVSASGPYSLDSDTVSWTYPSLGAGESQQVELVVQTAITATGAITNAAYGVRSDDVAPVHGPPVVVPVIPFSLEVSKQAPQTVAPGGILTYTLLVTNTHPFLPVHNVVLTDVLPANTAFVTATLPYTFSSGMVQWSFPGIPPDGSQEAALIVQVPITATGVVANEEYAARSAEGAAASGAPVQTRIADPLYALSVSKTAPNTVRSGGILTYTLQASNLHPSASTHNLILTDTLPANTPFLTATVPYTMTGDTISWQLPFLGPGAALEVELVVRVPISFTGVVTNANYGARSDEAPVVVGQPVRTDINSLALLKTASSEEVSAGDLLTYTLTVTNQHPLSATHGIVLSDTLPAGVTFAAADSGGVLQGDTVRWTAPSLASGQAWTVHLTVRVSQQAVGSVIVNEVYEVASAETPEPVQGAPVLTRVRIFYIYFPFVARGPQE